MSSAFTIIIPSYNGGAYFRQCVESVLAQEYDDYDVAVLDDGSTDGSVDWLLALGERRVKAYSSAHIGIVANWARAVDIPKRQFMTILGQDDLLDPHYLSVLDALVRRHPGAGLYHAHFRYIDDAGKTIRPCRPLPERETAAEYLTGLFTRERDTYGAGYVMRSGVYNMLGGIPHFPGLLFADDALWISLMRGAYKAVAADECFACRMHEASAGPSSSWQTWVAAMHEYIPFLRNVAAQDPEFARALEAHGADYFFHNARAIYLQSVVQATRRNEKADDTAGKQIAEALGVIAPERVDEFLSFDATPLYKKQTLINSNNLTRRLYNLYQKRRQAD